MNETLFMIVALLTGLALGSLFFGGLWFTLRKAMTSKIPALWLLGSFIFRVGIVLVGFYLILQQANWLSGLVCLVGFITARSIVIRLTMAYEAKTTLINKEVKRAVHET